MITFEEYGQKLMESFVEDYVDDVDKVLWTMPKYDMKTDILEGKLEFTIPSVSRLNKTYLTSFMTYNLNIDVNDVVVVGSETDESTNYTFNCSMDLGEHYELKLANFLTGNLELMEYKWSRLDVPLS